MPYAQGQPFIAIPGPSPTPERVLRAMHCTAPDIYSAEMYTDCKSLADKLVHVVGGGVFLAPYIGNGHAVWEAANANLFDPGDEVLLLASGHFGKSWAEWTQALGINVEMMDFGANAPDPSRLAERLAADKAGRIKAVMVCHTDTATSVTVDLRALRAAMEGHDALFVVDAVASLGCAELHMQDMGIDVLISASQKGLMSPPGLAYLWFSQKARDVADQRKTPRGLYWDWNARADADAMYRYWGGTPPVQLIHAQNEALDMLFEEGLEAAWARHKVLSRMVWTAFDAWNMGNDGISLRVSNPTERAASVTAANLPRANELRQWLTANTGVTLGIGLGAAEPENALRVAHMGYCNATQVLGAIGSMEAAMRALDIPHGAGALDAAAQFLAEKVAAQ